MALELSSPLNDRRGKANPPRTMLQSRLLFLRRSWNTSMSRIVVLEICNFYHRIREILRAPSLRYGPTIWSRNEDQKIGNCFPKSKFLDACTDNMQQLSFENPWIGYLEVQMGAQAFLRGAEWGLRIRDIENHSASDKQAFNRCPCSSKHE
jgi:hypothetical protein